MHLELQGKLMNVKSIIRCLSEVTGNCLEIRKISLNKSFKSEVYRLKNALNLLHVVNYGRLRPLIFRNT